MYDTTNWQRISTVLMLAAPLDVGIGKLVIGNTYPTMGGDTVRIDSEASYDGEEFFVGLVSMRLGGQFWHFYEKNGRDWTNNPNNPYAVDWPEVQQRVAKITGWGTA